jgi:hypothetical protein
MNRGTPMSNSNARKRLHPEPLPHWDPAVRALLAEERRQGRIEGWNARGEAMREDARRAAEVDL